MPPLSTTGKRADTGAGTAAPPGCCELSGHSAGRSGSDGEARAVRMFILALAAGGRTFFTVPEDHFNCPVGCYTLKIPLPPDRANELPDTLGLMTQIGYLKMQEVPGIPVLPSTPKTITYAPLGATPVDPDVVLVAATPGKLMLLEEAALCAGVAATVSLLARPTCMAIPAALAHGVVTSAGCIGNRVYTQLGDNELYAVIPGRHLDRVCGELQTILSANATLEQHHRARQAAIGRA